MLHFHFTLLDVRKIWKERERKESILTKEKLIFRPVVDHQNTQTDTYPIAFVRSHVYISKKVERYRLNQGPSGQGIRACMTP